MSLTKDLDAALKEINKEREQSLDRLVASLK
jgi:hypothetical protein